MKLHLIPLLLIFSVLLLNSCHNQPIPDEDTLIEIDVIKKYPEKEILLEDIADITYIHMELNDDYLYRTVRAITQNFVITSDMDGNMMFFTIDGKPVKKFNRKGNGPGEYNYIFNVFYNEKEDLLYVSDVAKILVYSSSGVHKRDIPLLPESFFTDMREYDDNTLLVYDNYEKYSVPFLRISKADGSITEEIHIPYEEKLNTTVRRQEGEMIYTISERNNNIVNHKDGFLLTHHSADTVYLYTHENGLKPVLVRTPSAQGMNPLTYLNSFVEADNYQFMRAITVEYDWTSQQGFPSSYLMRDKKDGQIYQQKIRMKDYKDKQIFLSPEVMERTQNHKTGLIYLNLSQLQNAYEENRLSGKLKDLFEELEEEDNDILMLLHFK